MMYKNHLYNLMNQCVQEHKSLWRIRDMYQKDTDNDAEREFWAKMVKDKEEHIAELTELIKAHLV